MFDWVLLLTLRKHVVTDVEQCVWNDDPVSGQTQLGCDKGNGQTGK